MRTVVAIVLIVSCTACRSLAKRFNDVAIGMTKPEVVAIVGEADTTAAKGEREFLIYNMSPDDQNAPRRREWFVCFDAGRVASFGRMGDFDSAKTPEETLNVNWQSNDIGPSGPSGAE